MAGMRPTITAQINGVFARFMLGSGAFYSMISRSAAGQFNLPIDAAPKGLVVTMISGRTDVRLTRVNLFTFADVPLPDVEFLVGGSELDHGIVGVLGQNFLSRFDVEYDLGRGVLRVAHVEDCKGVMLANWAGAGPVSTMDISGTTPLKPHTIGTVHINGAKITVMFDTGATASVITLKAAARAGVTPGMPGVVEAGYETGVGGQRVKTYLASFASFKIGDNEEIKNARLRIGDVVMPRADMLLGADFFLSHHLYVANSQHRLYLTYNGGPVFNLAPRSVDVEALRAGGDHLADAGTLFKEGTDLSSRGDYRHAIEDFTQAIGINANEPEYFYQRGRAYWQSRQIDLAAADFDHALNLDGNYVPALVTRAEFRSEKGDHAGATADLDAADRAAPQQADIRLSMAHLYDAADSPAAAIEQYDLWIANHPEDWKMASALSGRCWSRALNGADLAKALDDCNTAMQQVNKASQSYGSLLDSRALVQLRLGSFDKAVADYDSSLQMNPKKEWSLYGRGVAKTKLNRASEGEADKAAALAVSPDIADKFAHYGIAP